MPTPTESLQAINEKLDTLPERLAAVLRGGGSELGIKSFDRLNRNKGFEPQTLLGHIIGRAMGTEFETDIQEREKEEREQDKQTRKAEKRQEHERIKALELPEHGDIGLTPLGAESPSVAAGMPAMPSIQSEDNPSVAAGMPAMPDRNGGSSGGLGGDESLEILKDIRDLLEDQGGEKGSGSGKNLIGP